MTRTRDTLFLMMITGLYMFFLPYAGRGRRVPGAPAETIKQA